MKAPENVESDLYDNELYHINNMSLEDTKEKLEWSKIAFEFQL